MVSIPKSYTVKILIIVSGWFVKGIEGSCCDIIALDLGWGDWAEVNRRNPSMPQPVLEVGTSRIQCRHVTTCANVLSASFYFKKLATIGVILLVVSSVVIHIGLMANWVWILWPGGVLAAAIVSLMKIEACPVAIWRAAVKVLPGDVLQMPLNTKYMEIIHGECFLTLLTHC